MPVEPVLTVDVETTVDADAVDVTVCVVPCPVIVVVPPVETVEVIVEACPVDVIVVVEPVKDPPIGRPHAITPPGTSAPPPSVPAAAQRPPPNMVIILTWPLEVSPIDGTTKSEAPTCNVATSIPLVLLRKWTLPSPPG